jgi:uncharacterized protein YbjQ (UPF0145 family)
MKHTKNNRKKRSNKHTKTKRIYGRIKSIGGSGWVSYFLPFLGKKEEAKNPEVNVTKNPMLSEEEELEEVKSNKNEVIKKVDELYKVEIDKQRIEKEYIEDADISSWCGFDSEYEPVGNVHLSTFVGVDLIRSYATTVKNLVGVQGNLSEKFHRLRNEAFIELKNIMKVKKLDKVCNLNTNFWKDAGTIMLNLHATGLRKKKVNKNNKTKRV